MFFNSSNSQSGNFSRGRGDVFRIAPVPAQSQSSVLLKSEFVSAGTYRSKIIDYRVDNRHDCPVLVYHLRRCLPDGGLEAHGINVRFYYFANIKQTEELNNDFCDYGLGGVDLKDCVGLEEFVDIVYEAGNAFGYMRNRRYLSGGPGGSPSGSALPPNPSTPIPPSSGTGVGSLEDIPFDV